MSDFLARSLFFGAGISLLFYEVGLLLKKRFKLAVLNPLLIAILCVMASLKVLGVPYSDYNAGAQYLSWLLTPATVALAVPLYEELGLLRKNLPAVAGGILAGTFAGLAGILLLCRVFALDHQLYVTFLPKSITTAIGMGVAEELGGVAALTVAAIILTGILGNVAAEGLFRLFRIHDPIARGLALGTGAHAIGTAKAMELGEVEGAMSSLSIAVAGLLTVAAASVFAQFL
ncbi:LrgB family protein [Pseudoflavonifractor phocaeensis]|uniref:LrgB family protein n=1 Tax=Pseudoflavonifractor phocaeensis TaxID=1870988 RepID=UPI00313E88E0